VPYIEGGGSTTGLMDVDPLFQGKVAVGYPSIGAAGGFYTVAGQTSAVVAAALAANTMLMSMRFNPASSRKAYVSKIRVQLGVATQGVAGGIAGTLGIQRYTAQTPTGGTQRFPNRQFDTMGTASDMFDVRDSNAALTGTAPTWGTVVAVTLVPLVIVLTSGMVNTGNEWIYEPAHPTVLSPGDGLALRTQVAMPATQTWVYSYTVHWEEK
jgi:hypothetical protein